MPFDQDYELGNLVLIGPTGESGTDIEAPMMSVAPEITGVAGVGEVLTVSPGTWSGSPTFAYQWYDDGILIPGATLNTFMLTGSQSGGYITARVVASNAGGDVAGWAAAVGPVVLIINPPFIVSVGTVYAPTVFVQHMVDMPLLAAATNVYAPVIEFGAISVTVPFVVATGVVYAPTITYGSVTVNAPLIAGASTVYQPTVVWNQIIEVGYIAATTSLYTPTVTDQQIVEVPFINSAAAMYAPTISYGSITVNMNYIAAATTVYAPVVEVGSVDVMVPMIAATTSLYEPTVVVQPFGYYADAWLQVVDDGGSIEDGYFASYPPEGFGYDMYTEAPSVTGIFSAWVRFDEYAEDNREIFKSTQFIEGAFAAEISASYFSDSGENAWTFSIVTPTGKYAGATAYVNLIPPTNWAHMLVTWDLSLVGGVDEEKSIRIFIDGEELASGLEVYDAPYDNIDWNTWVWDTEIGTSIHGGLAEIYFAPSAWLDLDVSANVEKFRSVAGKPVSLGTTGELPTGSIPHLYLTGPVAAELINKATGSTFYMLGIVVDDEWSPSDAPKVLAPFIAATGHVFAPIIEGGEGAASTFYAVEFDGATDYLVPSTTGVVPLSSGKGVLSMWVRPNQSAAEFYDLFVSSTVQPDVISAFLEPAFGVSRISMSPEIGDFVDAYGLMSFEWMHYLASWDTETSGDLVIQLYINDLGQTYASTNDAIITNYTTHAGFVVGGYSGATFNGAMAQLFFAPGVFLDMSVEENRRKFITRDGMPANLGVNGLLAVGAEPAFYLNNPVSTWHINKGAAPDFVVEGGGLSASVDTPFDSYVPRAVYTQDGFDMWYPDAPLYGTNKGTLSVWFRLPEGLGVFASSFVYGSINIRIGTVGSLFYISLSYGPASDPTYVEVNGPLADIGTAWHHLALAWNADILDNDDGFVVYLDDEPLSRDNTYDEYGNSPSTTREFSFMSFGIYADFWMQFGEMVDLTNTTNRRKFVTADVKPVYLGDRGEKPLGYASDFMISGRKAAMDPNANFGIGMGVQTPERLDESEGPFTRPNTPLRELIAYQFEGTGYFERGTFDGAAQAASGVLSFWIRFQDPMETGLIYSFRSADNNDAFECQHLGDGSLYFMHTFEADQSATSITVPDIGEWTHILLSWDSADVTAGRVYVNGEMVDYNALNSGAWYNPLNVQLFTSNMINPQAPGAGLTFEISDFYFAPGNFLDLSVQANREPFIKAGKQGRLNGGIPVPLVFLVSTAGSNYGTGGAFNTFGDFAEIPGPNPPPPPPEYVDMDFIAATGAMYAPTLTITGHVASATGTNTASFSSGTIKAGDLILVYAYNFAGNATTGPSNGSGYTSIVGSQLGTSPNRIGYRVSRKIAAIDNETIPTFNGAELTIASVYRGYATTGASATTTNVATASTVNIPSVSMQVTDGTSMVACAAAAVSKTTTVEQAVSGITARANVIAAGTYGEAANFDTGVNVTSFAAKSLALGSQSYVRTNAVELRKT